MLTRILYIILQHNRLKKSPIFIDVLSLKDTDFINLKDLDLKKESFDILKQNPELIKQTILNNQYLRFNSGFLTKKEIKMEENKINCTECENETMLKYADLVLELDKYKRYNKILEDCLDTKDELCKVLRDKNEELMNKNELYLEKIRKLEGEEQNASKV